MPAPATADTVPGGGAAPARSARLVGRSRAGGRPGRPAVTAAMAALYLDLRVLRALRGREGRAVIRVFRHRPGAHSGSAACSGRRVALIELLVPIDTQRVVSW